MDWLCKNNLTLQLDMLPYTPSVDRNIVPIFAHCCFHYDSGEVGSVQKMFLGWCRIERIHTVSAERGISRNSLCTEYNQSFNAIVL